MPEWEGILRIAFFSVCDSSARKPALFCLSFILFPPNSNWIISWLLTHLRTWTNTSMRACLHICMDFHNYANVYFRNFTTQHPVGGGQWLFYITLISRLFFNHNQLSWTSRWFVKASLCWMSIVYSNVCRGEEGLSLRLLSPSLSLFSNRYLSLCVSMHAFLFHYLSLEASLPSSWGYAELISASPQARLWGTSTWSREGVINQQKGETFRQKLVWLPKKLSVCGYVISIIIIRLHIFLFNCFLDLNNI